MGRNVSERRAGADRASPSALGPPPSALRFHEVGVNIALSFGPMTLRSTRPVAILDGLGIQRTHLCGLSLGGPDPMPRSRRFIAAVDRHIENIYGELTIQMKRMARIQAQVDDLRDKIRKAL